MNKLIVLCGILFVISCGEEYNDNAAYDPKYSNDSQNELFQYATITSESIAHATKNVSGLGNNSWVANSSLYILKNKYFFTFQTINNNQEKFNRELLVFDFLPKLEGKFIFKNSANKFNDDPALAYIRIADDGDVGLRGWYPSQYHDSFIEIEKIDSLNKKVYVSFDAYFDYETEFNKKAREKGSEYREKYWSKNINFIGGRAVLDFPK